MAAFYEDEMEEDQQTFDEFENNYMNESRSMISRMITQNQNNFRFMLPPFSEYLQYPKSCLSLVSSLLASPP